MKKQKTIIITGTHHTPAIELINLLKKDLSTNWEIYYLGHQYSSETHITNTIIPILNRNFYNLDCGKFDRKNIDITLKGIPKIIKSFFKSLSLITQIKPNVIVSFGGYVSVPVVIAGFIKKIPSITHEQTLTNGLATIINSHFVTKVALSFNNQEQLNSLPKQKTVITGNLIREEIYNTHSVKFSKIKQPFIYITGGNQGSKFINNLIIDSLPTITKRFTVIHQTGKNDISLPESNDYHPVEFVGEKDIGFVLNKAEIVISRSGANTCQELNLLDKKSIQIPLPYTQQEEQQKNALWLKSLHPKTTIILTQESADQNSLINSINYLSATNHTSTPTKLPLVNPLMKLIDEIVS